MQPMRSSVGTVVFFRKPVVRLVMLQGSLTLGFLSVKEIELAKYMSFHFVLFFEVALNTAW